MSFLSSFVSVLALGVAGGGRQAAFNREENRWLNMFTSVPPIVEKAIAAQTSLRFSGTRIVTFRKGPDVDRHTEFVIKDGTRLRIEFPGESRFSGQIIVETPEDRRHFFPRRNVIHVTPPRREPLFEHLWRGGGRRNGQKLRITEVTGEKVAGLPTELLSVVDSAGNVIQTLNVNPHSGLVLKRTLFDMVGSEVGSSEFTEVNFHPNISGASFVLKRKGVLFTTPADDLSQIARKNGFLNALLSPGTGFSLDSCRIIDIAGEKVLASQYYSPRGHLTVFQLAQGVDPEKLKRKAPPEIHAHVVQISGHWFALVGPLDEQVLTVAASRIQIRN